MCLFMFYFVLKLLICITCLAWTYTRWNLFFDPKIGHWLFNNYNPYTDSCKDYFYIGSWWAHIYFFASPRLNMTRVANKDISHFPVISDLLKIENTSYTLTYCYISYTYVLLHLCVVTSVTLIYCYTYLVLHQYREISISFPEYGWHFIERKVCTVYSEPSLTNFTNYC